VTADELVKNNTDKGIQTHIFDDPIQYMDYTASLFYKGFFLSRGHEKLNWHLLPSIFRKQILDEINPHIDKDNYESYLSTEFSDKFNYYQDHPDVSTDDTNCLIAMQHYGLPTRLLDWTNNQQVSLFFAVNYAKRNKNKKRENVVWFLDPTLYRRIYGTPGGTYYRQMHDLISKRCSIAMMKRGLQSNNDIKYPLFFSPKYLFSRIEAQDSIFSVHGLEKESFENLPHADKFLQCVIIIDEGDKFYNYVNNILCLTHRKMFPDVFGFVEFMKRANTK